jgi:hypothetical protein
MASCLVLGCGTGNNGRNSEGNVSLLKHCRVVTDEGEANADKQNPLDGMWMLQQMEHPAGYTRTYAESEETYLQFYDGDSLVYLCLLTRTETGLTVKPVGQQRVMLVDKGHGEYVYMEDDAPHPLTVKGDSVIVIQEQGVLYTWHRADDIANEWSTEIKEILATDMQKGRTGEQRCYMLSAKERRQASFIQWILAAFAVFVVLTVSNYVVSRRRRQQLQLQLQQIQEVQQERPQVVRQAIESVETAYFASDEYQALQRRIATGDILKEEDWLTIESQIKKVFPGFSSQLRNLHAMSDLEYQVCLLIKLRVAPSDMAVVLARDASTISTVRSRLYKKVFGRKGGAREWDEFILSIG